MGIVVAGMHPRLVLVAGGVELSVAFNVVVITYALVVESGVVAALEVLDGEALVAASGTAMDDNKVYCAHDCTAIDPRTEVITVAMNFRTFATLVQLTFAFMLSLV